MLVYHSLVSSKLRYGLICWASASQFLLDKVNVVHNKIITYMTFEKRNRPIWPLYCQLNVLPLSLLIQIEYAKTMYKFENKLLPQVFENYLRNCLINITHTICPKQLCKSKNFNSKRDKSSLS